MQHHLDIEGLLIYLSLPNLVLYVSFLPEILSRLLLVLQHWMVPRSGFSGSDELSPCQY
jgi:hypothetical protein